MVRILQKDLDILSFLEYYDKRNRINKGNLSLLERLFEYKESIKSQFDAPGLLAKLNKKFFIHRSPQNIEYWLERGWDEISAKQKVEQQNNIQARSNGWYIEKYGSIEGRNEYEKMCRNMSYKKRLFEKYPKEIAQKKYDAFLESQHGTNTLEDCITRFGEVEGTKKYNTRIEKLKSYNYKELFIEKKGKEQYDEMNKRRTNTLKKQYLENPNSNQFRGLTEYYNVSNVSVSLFNQIIEKLSIDIDDDTVYFGENEKVIELDESDLLPKYVKPDFLWNNKVIEFYGTYWHRDARFYDNSDENLKIRSRDAIRLKALQEKGYDIKVVWSEDYKNDPLKIIDECVLFLKNIV